MTNWPNNETIHAACQTLGLGWEIAPYDLHGDGTIDGIFTRVAWVPAGLIGAVETTCWFNPPFGLGLRAASDTGETRTYRVTSDHPPAADAIFSPAARAALEAIVDGGVISVTDAEIKHTRKLHGTVASSVFVDDARAVLAAAHSMNAARANCPPPAALAAHAVAAENYAAQHGLRSQRIPPCVYGRSLHGELSVAIARSGGGYTIGGRIKFDRALNLGLDVAPTRNLHLLARAWTALAGQDVRVGDAVFDGSFVVRSKRPEAVASMLNEPLRRGLVDLFQRYDNVHLYDGELVVGPASLVVSRSAALAELAAEISRFADAIAASISQP